MALLLLQRQLARQRPVFFKRALSTKLEVACADQNNRDCGAYTLLAALEKAKEADDVQVAHLVASLGYLLPPPHTSQQHTTPTLSHSSDPAFFSIPDPKWNKQNVINLLQASLRGRRIDLPTVHRLLRAATNHFQQVPSVVSIPKLQSSEQVTVVGDLHGSLTDLNTVLGLIGDPSSNNRVVFNGDLADRGDHGIEVIAIVCALALAFPEHVYLNRGNHEDLALSVAYGLASELQHKYGTTAFRRLSPLLDDFFRSLPLVTVVQDDALIVHAGPPPPGWTLASLEEQLAKAKTLSSRTSRMAGEEGTTADVIVESCLWSDPDVDEEDGTLVQYIQEDDHLKPNLSRGAGFKFDATIVKALLEKEGLSRLIRSHEPVHNGCARYTVCTECEMELFTVFSASRYPYKQGFNYGAILRLQADGKHQIQRYATEEDEPILEASKGEEDPLEQTLDTADSTTIRRALKEVIQTRRPDLDRAFKNAGDDIPFAQSMDILVRGLNLQGEGLSQKGPMLALAKALTDDDTLPPTLDILGVLDARSEQDGEEDTRTQNVASGWLQAIFAMVDSNHDNEIDKAEWLAAVESMNSKLPETAQRIDAEVTWKLLDQNGDGHISASEWSTLSRITCR